MIYKLLITVLLSALPIGLVALAADTHQDKTAKTKVKAKKHLTKSRIEIKSTASQMAAGIQAAEAALTPAELAIADRIYLGRFPCELDTFVTLTADPRSPGYFDMQIRKIKYRMSPVLSSTGAIRLEDRQAGAVWLQLANKSMLMNQKLGQRLADECVNPDQATFAEAMIKNPPPSLLDLPQPAPETR